MNNARIGGGGGGGEQGPVRVRECIRDKYDSDAKEYTDGKGEGRMSVSGEASSTGTPSSQSSAR
jgi:hypothetical protein